MIMSNKEDEDKKCEGGKWEKDCDDWDCVGGCKYKKQSLTSDTK